MPIGRFISPSEVDFFSDSIAKSGPAVPLRQHVVRVDTCPHLKSKPCTASCFNLGAVRESVLPRMGDEVFAKRFPMLSSTNFWLCFVGLTYLVAGLLILCKEISASHDWDKLIASGGVFMAAPLAVFATEHFRGARFIQNMVPSWMPAHLFWAYFVGCALLKAATSLTVRKLVRWSSTLLGLMFVLFVCMIHIPNALAHPHDRFAWAVAIRDLAFAGGAWALAGLHSRASSPQQSKWMILFGRIVVAIAAVFFSVEHFLHPEFAPGVPLEKLMPRHYRGVGCLWPLRGYTDQIIAGNRLRIGWLAGI
jgi:hypothetical protein